MKRVKERTQTTWLVVALVGFTANAVAQPSAEELRRSIQERSQRIEEYRALLTDSNQSVRLAALDEMLKSDDTAMQTLAYETGFNSSDNTMRAVALKNRVGE